MKNLKITSTAITVQGKQIIADNTINYAWNYLEGKTPSVVNFNLQRGVAGGELSFTGNSIISGAFYTESEKFDIVNNNFKQGDFDLYQEILNTCKEIISELEQG